MYPDVDRFDIATEKLITAYEKTLGYQLPLSFVEFLMKFSNGIFLLDCEPIGGVSKKFPCSDIRKANCIITDIPNDVLNAKY